MNLAAMVDLGVDRSYLINELQKLNLHGYSIAFLPDQRKGITGIRADVVVSNEHGHDHDQHDHHNERKYSDIKSLIGNSSLNDNVKKLSIEIFGVIAEAEAHVHGKSVDEIHFHEVGAVDARLDREDLFA